MQLVTNPGGVPATPKVPWKYRLSSILARKSLQRFWEITNAISLRGMGYSNHYRELNGESRFLRIRSEEHTSELQSLMRISYADFCVNKKHSKKTYKSTNQQYYKHKQILN